MNHPLPANMKAPGDHRKGIWRNGVLQIKVTNACDLDCKNCSVAVGLAKKLHRIFWMSPDQFRAALRSLKGYFGVIGMFGGNPCIHPRFEDLCAIFREEVPDQDQRGLWSDKLFGHGKLCRATFSPAHSNLNVHGRSDAWAEIKRDWPEARPLAASLGNGREDPSQHAPIWATMGDLIPDETERWKLIGSCYVNQTWSAEITLVDGQLAAYFCEIAATQAELYGDASRGMAVLPGWWRRPMADFEAQARHYCNRCGVPLNGRKVKASDEEAAEDYSAAHAPLFLTIEGRPLRLVTDRAQIEGGTPATKYLSNGVMPAGHKA